MQYVQLTNIFMPSTACCGAKQSCLFVTESFAVSMAKHWLFHENQHHFEGKGDLTVKNYMWVNWPYEDCLMSFQLTPSVLYICACAHIYVIVCVSEYWTYLTQLSQSIFPTVSLMVRSDTNAGYSVSQGTNIVLPPLWARERERNIVLWIVSCGRAYL